MEMRGTDFTKRNHRDTLVITLGTEEDHFDLHIMVPTKGIYDDMEHAAGLVDAVMERSVNGAECIDELYAHVTRAMSFNTEGREITAEYLNEIGFDFVDIAAFLGDYTQFLLLLATSKN